MVDQKIIDAFHLMWDSFPEPVRLIEKSRTILAVNKASEKDGSQVGTTCSSKPPLEAHKICKANAALAAQEYRYIKWKGESRDVISFWLPIDGYPEYFIHFSVGYKLSYE